MTLPIPKEGSTTEGIYSSTCTFFSYCFTVIISLLNSKSFPFIVRVMELKILNCKFLMVIIVSNQHIFFFFEIINEVSIHKKKTLKTFVSKVYRFSLILSRRKLHRNGWQGRREFIGWQRVIKDHCRDYRFKQQKNLQQ